jgi:hypothetical protein
VPRRNIKDKAKKRFSWRAFGKKLWRSRVTWAIISFILGYFLTVSLNLVVLPMFSEHPELSVQVFPSDLPYQVGQTIDNITWNNGYIMYIVMIQQNMAVAKSTPIDDIHLTFDFNSAVLATGEEEITNVINPSVQIPFVFTSAENNMKPLQVIVEIGNLNPSGLYSFSVVVDPNFQGSTYRTVAGLKDAYSGQYFYLSNGNLVEKEISGNITST